MIDLVFGMMKGNKVQTTQVITITIFPNRELRFAMMSNGLPKYSPIEGLKLSPSGILKEFPDLEGKPIGEMRKEAIGRLKEHIRKMKSVTEVKEYLKKDLQKHGYKLIMSQRKGHRPMREN